jgi:hypothetical protein
MKAVSVYFVAESDYFKYNDDKCHDTEGYGNTADPHSQSYIHTQTFKKVEPAGCIETLNTDQCSFSF